MFSFLSGPFAAFGKALGAGGASPDVAAAFRASMGQAVGDAARGVDTMVQGARDVAADPVGSAQGYMNDQMKAYIAQATGRAPMPAQQQSQPPAMPELPAAPAPQVVAPQPRRTGAQAQMPGYFRRPMIPGLFDR